MRYLVLILISCTLSSQNLVPNPGFETVAFSNFQFGDLHAGAPWMIPANSGNSSPDYFNSCQTANYLRVPINFFGSQQAFEGNAYAGIATYSIGTTNHNREYLETPLLSPLIAGEEYTVSYYVSLADNFGWSSNNVNAVLTEQPLTGNGTNQNINVIPQIVHQDIITNTSGWTLLSGTFVAAGNEQYLTIGNFALNTDTQAAISNASATFLFSDQAYYYVDNVSVMLSSLAQNEFTQERVSLYPNPTANRFSIATSQNDTISKVVLYSSYQRVKEFGMQQSQFDISDLPTGIYFVSVSFESGKKRYTKIVKL